MSQKTVSNGVVHEVPADLKKALACDEALLARMRPPLIQRTETA